MYANFCKYCSYYISNVQVILLLSPKSLTRLQTAHFFVGEGASMERSCRTQVNMILAENLLTACLINCDLLFFPVTRLAIIGAIVFFILIFGAVVYCYIVVDDGGWDYFDDDAFLSESNSIDKTPDDTKDNGPKSAETTFGGDGGNAHEWGEKRDDAPPSYSKATINIVKATEDDEKGSGVETCGVPDTQDKN